MTVPATSPSTWSGTWAPTHLPLRPTSIISQALLPPTAVLTLVQPQRDTSSPTPEERRGFWS